MALKMAFTDIAEAKAALSKVLELMNSPANREKLGPLLEECKGDPAKRTTVVRAPRACPLYHAADRLSRCARAGGCRSCPSSRSSSQ